ncbi:MAG: universal stress protein, partial [Bacteroidota bacterium]
AVHFLHVYTVPTGYPSLRHPPLDLRATLRTRAVRRLETFIEALDLRGLTPELHLAESPDVPGTILSEAAALGADLMMVGTRGRSPSAAILLGSVAEQVLRAAPVPVVAVKRKGATTRLLDVLLEQHVARAEDRPMVASSDSAYRLPAFERV